MLHGVVKLDKPIYTGFSVLELSKLHMYVMYYDVMKVKYEKNITLMFTDTDSFCFISKHKTYMMILKQ